MQQRAWFRRLTQVAGCGLIAATMAATCAYVPWLPPLTEPADATPVLGGIVDTRPMFGKTLNVDGAEAGEFLLASCGCGDWRVLIKDADGRQMQCAVRYYSEGEYAPDVEIAFFGATDAITARGIVDQPSGAVSGELDVDQFRRSFSAQRRETHENDIEACILCHIGDDPIYPQPDTHVPYVDGVTNCFDCHEVVIE